MPVVLTRRGPETHYKKWKVVIHRGRILRTDEGGQIELFTRWVMADAIERSGPYIVYLEHFNDFPSPTYRLGESKTRYYSADQVANANNVYRAFKGDRNVPRGFFRVFVTALREVFRLERVAEAEELREIRDRVFVPRSVILKGRRGENDTSLDGAKDGA